MIEKWLWDGITGHSCIVPLDSLSKAKIDAQVFTEVLIKALSIEGPTTTKQSEGFLFLNFNFET
jgi:hypothetical protein